MERNIIYIWKLNKEIDTLRVKRDAGNVKVGHKLGDTANAYEWVRDVYVDANFELKRRQVQRIGGSACGRAVPVRTDERRKSGAIRRREVRLSSAGGRERGRAPQDALVVSAWLGSVDGSELAPSGRVLAVHRRRKQERWLQRGADQRHSAPPAHALFRGRRSQVAQRHAKSGAQCLHAGGRRESSSGGTLSRFFHLPGHGEA